MSEDGMAQDGSNITYDTVVILEDFYLNSTSNITNVTMKNFGYKPNASLRIGLYSVIFILTVVGNLLVIGTLVQNKRMRTVTNMFLLNLAISDLLLGVFCMPVTLIGSILRNFVFGATLCYLIPFFQAVSVSVSVWTLVVISLERYFAICRPLHSRRWQTISHAYRVIAAIWIGSLLSMVPIACFSKLLPTRAPGNFKCREMWPSINSERVYNIYLDMVLLLFPFVIMTAAYALISKTLWLGIRVEIPKKSNFKYSEKNLKKQQLSGSINVYELQCNGIHEQEGIKTISQSTRPKQPNNWLVRGNHAKNKKGKKRVIRMLFVVVIEFFICWTPLYVVNTWYLFDPVNMYSHIGTTGMSIIHLLAYVSCCCNPITYCFMHNKFRQGFISVMTCSKRKRWPSARGSDYSGTMNSIYSTRLSSLHTDAVERVEDDSL